MRIEDVLDVWDSYHPVDAEEELEGCSEGDDFSDLDLAPQIPTIDVLPEYVDYSARGPGDFVISGPLGAGKGPGRHFNTALAAQNWAVSKYGRNRVKRVEGEGSEFRWAFLIKAVA